MDVNPYLLGGSVVVVAAVLTYIFLNYCTDRRDPKSQSARYSGDKNPDLPFGKACGNGRPTVRSNPQRMSKKTNSLPTSSFQPGIGRSPLPTETEAPMSTSDACNKEWSAPELLPAVPKDFKEHPDRDLTNYPYPSRPMYPPKSRLLMMPDSWFTPIQKVTGTSGPYLFFGGLFAFLVNKELWVFEEQGHMTVGWTAGYKTDAGLYKDYQDRVGFFKGLIQEDLKEAVEFRKTSAEQSESLAALRDSMPTSLKESMQLQIEASYRKNVQIISSEIKRRVDYLKETEETKSATLLIQSSPRLDSRTWCDYESVTDALDAICKMFEEFLSKKSAGAAVTYDVSQVYEFLDKLSDVSLMIFNRETGQYIGRTRAWIKQQVYELMRGRCQHPEGGEKVIVGY